MADLLQPTHLLVLFVIVLIFFGGRKLPGLGKGLGEGLRGFKDGLMGKDQHNSDTSVSATTAAKAD